MISSVRTTHTTPHLSAFTWANSFSFSFFCVPPPLSANLVLEDTVERIYHQDVFAEQWVGLFLIRGENVVLLGEIVSTPPFPLSLAFAVWRSQSFTILITLPRLLGP